MAVAPPTSHRLDVAVIADAHLGTPQARPRELADYLASVHPRALVVAGGLLDLAALRGGSVPDEHLAVVRRLLELARGGTRVYVLTGNHDAALGRFGDLALGNLHVRRDLELHFDGGRYFFCHGDRLKATVRLGLPTAADAPLRRLAAWVDGRRRGVLRALGRPSPSLARGLRVGGDGAALRLARYRAAAARLAAERGCDTVVCAHVQRPEVSTVALPDLRDPVRYLNPGDWVAHLTALEYRWGEWRLRRYDVDDAPPRSERLRATAPPHERGKVESLLERIVASGPTARMR